MGSYLVSHFKKQNKTIKITHFLQHTAKKKIILQIVHNTLYILCRELLKISVYCTVNKSGICVLLGTLEYEC